MNDAQVDIFPYAVSGIVGLVVSLAIMIMTGRNEAWDSGVYFTVGIPLMCALIFFVSYKFPGRAWRWTLAMAAGQFVAIWFGSGSMSLWPIALVVMLLFSVPQFISGFVASKMAMKVSKA